MPAHAMVMLPVPPVACAVKGTGAFTHTVSATWASRASGAGSANVIPAEAWQPLASVTTTL